MITFKRKDKILFHSDLEISEMGEQEQTIEEIKQLFDKEEILNYHLSFKPGVLTEQIHRFDEITPEMVQGIIITLR